MSRAQIDKLGERLKAGPTTAADLRLLDEYRQTFRAAYAEVVTAVADLGFAPTGRPAKSTSAIIDKLRRESIRLAQIQDIAGCRIVVVDRLEQDTVAARLRERLVEVEIVDRRVSPSHGIGRFTLLLASRDSQLKCRFAPCGSITGPRRRSDWRMKLAQVSSTDKDRPICSGR